MMTKWKQFLILLSCFCAEYNIKLHFAFNKLFCNKFIEVKVLPTVLWFRKTNKMINNTKRPTKEYKRVQWNGSVKCLNKKLSVNENITQ